MDSNEVDIDVAVARYEECVRRGWVPSGYTDKAIARVIEYLMEKNPQIRLTAVESAALEWAKAGRCDTANVATLLALYRRFVAAKPQCRKLFTLTEAVADYELAKKSRNVTSFGADTTIANTIERLLRDCDILSFIGRDADLHRNARIGSVNYTDVPPLLEMLYRLLVKRASKEHDEDGKKTLVDAVDDFLWATSGGDGRPAFINGAGAQRIGLEIDRLLQCFNYFVLSPSEQKLIERLHNRTVRGVDCRRILAFLYRLLVLEYDQFVSLEHSTNAGAKAGEAFSRAVDAFGVAAQNLAASHRASVRHTEEEPTVEPTELDNSTVSEKFESDNNSRKWAVLRMMETPAFADKILAVAEGIDNDLISGVFKALTGRSLWGYEICSVIQTWEEAALEAEQQMKIDALKEQLRVLGYRGEV